METTNEQTPSPFIPEVTPVLETLGHPEIAFGGRVMAIRTDYKRRDLSSLPDPSWVTSFVTLRQSLEEKGFSFLGAGGISNIELNLQRTKAQAGHVALFLLPEGTPTQVTDTSYGKTVTNTDALLQVEFKPPFLGKQTAMLKSMASWASAAVDRFGKSHLTFAVTNSITNPDYKLFYLQATQ